MYVLALVFALSNNTTQTEIIGAYSALTQCEAASIAYSSKTKCYYLDPQKGMQEVNASDTRHSN